MRSVIVGCPFDNGIRSMLRFGRGITGAANGPRAVFQAFSKEFSGKYKGDLKLKMLPLQKYNFKLKAENINDVMLRKQQKRATIKAHEIMTKQIKEICKQGYIPISVGGDHSVTYPLCRGVCLGNPGKRFGIIYIDAHFDMRDFDKDDQVGGVISSGNPFRRLIEDEQLNIDGKNVVAIGIHNSGSEIYKELENYAKAKNVTVFYDDEVKGNVDKIIKIALERAGQNTDFIYFSVDIDGVNKAFAPGVSAPADSGISEGQLYSLVKGISRDKRVIAFDLAEISSRELAWFEIIKGESRNESYKERMRKLEQTAKVGAKAIDCFLESKLLR